MAPYILSNGPCGGLARCSKPTLFLESPPLGVPKVSGNTSVLRIAVSGLAVAACLGTYGCSQRAKGTVPTGSKVGAQVCDGKDKERIDVNGDGRADIEHVMRNGRRVCTKADMNFDGKVDVERFYESDGVTLAHVRHDFDFDGQVDQLSFYEDGRLARIEMDTTFNNSIDTWLWCTEGWVSRSERDRSANGKPDVWEGYDKGLIVEASYDENNDGQPDRWDVFRGGKLIMSKHDDSGDGQPDRTDEVPLRSLGPADDALRCEPVEVAENMAASTSGSSDAGADDAAQGETK